MLELESLPPRQKEVVRLIVELTEEHGYPPTLAELAKSMGLRNRMTVHQHVAALKKKGIVKWEPGLNRSLRVIDSVEVSRNPIDEDDDVVEDEIATPPVGIPFAGTIAAGRPIDAVHQDEYLEIDSQYTGGGCFALKVKGDSMIEDGIHDGDYVIIKPEPSPKQGEIVVALLEDGSATLKRFFKEKNRFRLQPANSEMEPIYVDSLNDLQIQGIVVALFRKM
ncbi:MAG: transcriptional repressor LexA [Candidatus Obscuribacterales bacterium]|nr:transcriptional repressor LexA [Candidatus Obscuribacterales bacterium]